MKWTLTSKDIFILMKVLGAKALIGISNPFLYNNESEVEKEWEHTFKKLHKIGLVDLINEEIKFEDTFIGAMWVIARTNLITEIIVDNNDKSLFYFSDQYVVECHRLEDDQYDIYLHGSPDQTWNHTIFPKMLMGVENLPVRFSEHLLIDPEDYKKYCLNSKIHNIEQIALNNKLENSSLLVNQFNRSVQRKIHNNRLMMFYQMNNKWNVEGIHILTSPAYNWTLRMIHQNSREWLEARQGTGTDILKEIMDIIKRVKQEQAV
ncbi:hypothetical protein [Metabacillus fastidiosus]|uniref:hypothetical protein n=1 Tax=Metabacillus fastidiosus TaxID=1458 RepID=UPI003D2C1C9A